MVRPCPRWSTGDRDVPGARRARTGWRTYSFVEDDVDHGWKRGYGTEIASTHYVLSCDPIASLIGVDGSVFDPPESGGTGHRLAQRGRREDGRVVHFTSSGTRSRTWDLPRWSGYRVHARPRPVRCLRCRHGCLWRVRRWGRLSLCRRCSRGTGCTSPRRWAGCRRTCTWRCSSPTQLRVVAVSDGSAFSGVVRLSLPDGWSASWTSLPVSLPAGGYVSTDVRLRPIVARPAATRCAPRWTGCRSWSTTSCCSPCRSGTSRTRSRCCGWRRRRRWCGFAWLVGFAAGHGRAPAHTARCRCAPGCCRRVRRGSCVGPFSVSGTACPRRGG